MGGGDERHVDRYPYRVIERVDAALDGNAVAMRDRTEHRDAGANEERGILADLPVRLV